MIITTITATIAGTVVTTRLKTITAAARITGCGRDRDEDRLGPAGAVFTRAGKAVSGVHNVPL